MARNYFVNYKAESEEKIKELEKVYNEFKEQYALDINKGRLIVKERFDKKCIEIFPEEKNGKILSIRALKPTSELETKLIKISWQYKNSSFKTKYNQTIEVEMNHKRSNP
jgi:predicted GH43/DUF377 family glycosyl hydrolase